MSKYVIRITRRTPADWRIRANEEHIHYYSGATERKDIYQGTYNRNLAATFTEWESKIIIKAVESIYKDHSDINGTLLKIEILDNEEWKVMSMRRFNQEPEVITSRFELMDL